MKKQLLSALLASVCFGAAVPAMAQNLAVVNGQAIPQARYDYFIDQFVKAGREKTPELEQHVKEELVRRAVYEQEAAKLGLDKTQDFQQEMDLARQTLLIRALFQKEQQEHPITDAAVKAEYDKFVAANKGTEYHSAHILVETEDEAKAIIADLKKDAKKFEALAKEKSKDPGSGSNGGDLGWSRPEAYVPEFGEALAKLKKGEISDTPVKTQFGWHVLQLKDTRPVQPPALDAVKPQIQQALAEQQLVEYQEKLYKAAKID
ncbi:peptidylprolyl isomerase [Corticibacter populi]|uniref:peptidylprolyl isomerase n=1 Tax=Corticibacter populi TaxID=1550736 RepID=A0A3M6QZ73_9BURK|nr:peptidylprolyl isomerase [Corticibacter populi]RMX08278.1 peptidylprolyl isomerase [Corticibacter populi]RZS35557.1 peptidyl-prolyl cis-trans isomerase C [Corticibacter populi]